MLEKVCLICKEKFLRKKSQVILNGGKYCSDKCRHIGKRSGRNILCSFCGQEVYRSLGNLNKSKSGDHFCSKKCLLDSISIKYDGHPNWKGGRFSSYREKLIKNDKNFKCFLCREDELRMLAVHHIDKNRLNNSLENLIWLCHNCHFLVHHYKKEQEKLFNKLHDKKM